MLRESKVVAVRVIHLWICPAGTLVMDVGGVYCDSLARLAFAKSDGFKSVNDMLQEFESMGELPLKDGIVIYWE